MPLKLPFEVRRAILERVFGSTPERQTLLKETESTIENIANHPNTRRLYLFGSGSSKKPNPSDIDLLVRLKDPTKPSIHKTNVESDKVHVVPTRKLANEKYSPEEFETLVSDMMLDQGINRKVAERRAKSWMKYTDTGRTIMKVGRERYGDDYKWTRLAGLGGAATGASAWLTSEGDAVQAPAPEVAPGANPSNWLTSESEAPPMPQPQSPLQDFNSLVSRVQKVESNNNPNAVSSKGAVGLMQTMPSTLRDPGYGVTPARNDSPEEQKRVGDDYLEAMLRRFGDVRQALAAYNWGPRNVEAAISDQGEGWEKKLPNETKTYINKVIGTPALSMRTRTRVPPARVVPQVEPREGGWLSTESDANPPPVASSPSPPSAPPSNMITGKEIDAINRQYGSSEQAPMGRVMEAEDPELSFLNDLALGTAVMIPSTLMVKAAGKNPASLLGGLAIGAIAAPLYVFSKGILTRKPTTESLKDLPSEFAWWIAGGELAPVIIRGGSRALKGAASAMADKVMPGIDYMAHGPLKRVLKPLEPLGDKVWNTIVTPFNKELPIVHKSVAEMMQPGVERMAKSPKLAPTAKTFRNIEIQRSHTRYLGEQMGKELNKLSPRERYDVSLGLRGESYDTLAPKAQELLNTLDTGIRDAKLTTRYENAFREEWGRALQSKLGANESELGDTAIKAMMNVTDAPLAAKSATGRSVRVKDIHKALDEVISDPNASKELQTFARDLYNLPADTAEMVYQSSNRVGMQLLQQKLIATPGIVSHQMKPGYIKTDVGKLKGLYVPRDVHMELKSLVDVPRISRGFYQKWMLSPWKTAKVIVRPATHIRNMVSNTILNDWGGLPFWRVDMYMKSLAEMSRKGSVWKDFSQRSGHYANFATSDVSNLEAGLRHGASIFDRMYNVYNKAVAPAGSLYSAEETWFKLAKYMHNIERGFTKNEAAMDAMKWTFNYAETTPEVAKIGKYAMPFVRWYSKAIPLMAETAVKHPIRFGKWLAFGAGLQQYAMNSTGTSEDEWNQIQQTLPDYIKNGIYLPMPWRDDNGRLNLMNMTYIMPGIGDINELYQRSLPELAIQNPFITLAGTLLSKKKFSGAPLYYDWEEPSTKLAKSLSYTWEMLSPAIMPGGTDWNSLYRAVTEGEEGTGPSAEEALAGWFGFKLTPIDPAANVRRSEAVKKIHDSELSVMMQKELRKASSEQETEAILQRYQKLREGIHSSGSGDAD